MKKNRERHLNIFLMRESLSELRFDAYYSRDENYLNVFEF